MRINQIISYNTMTNTFSRQNKIDKNVQISRPISFGDVEYSSSYDEYIKTINSKEGQMRQKSAGIDGLVQTADRLYEDTRKLNTSIYGNLKKAVKAGEKINFDSYMALDKVNGIMAKLVYGEISENGLPRTITFIEPRSEQPLLEYELNEHSTKNQFLNYTVKDYMQKRETEYEMNEDKIVSVTERSKISDTESQLMPYRNGYHYVVSRVSNDGKTAEPIKSLVVSNDKKNGCKKYIEFDRNEKTVYSYNPKAKLWIEE